MWKGEKMIALGGIMTLNNENIALFLKHMRAGKINCESTWLGLMYIVVFNFIVLHFINYCITSHRDKLYISTQEEFVNHSSDISHIRCCSIPKIKLTN